MQPFIKHTKEINVMSGGITTSEPRLLDKTGRKLVMAIAADSSAKRVRKDMEVLS